MKEVGDEEIGDEDIGDENVGAEYTAYFEALGQILLADFWV